MIVDSDVFQACAKALCEAGAFFFSRDWCPATSSNFSARVDDRHIAITVSGRHKGELTRNDIMLVDFNGAPVDSAYTPSAETLLHTQLYRHDARIGAVLHTHSVNATVLSRQREYDHDVILRNYELLKALRGICSHDTEVRVPVYRNTQDMNALAAQVEKDLASRPMWGYLIAGHGLYAWGRNVAEARRHIEAFEFLFSCELAAYDQGCGG
jgi:methylthioribulose-1-phosphate dehydratase